MTFFGILWIVLLFLSSLMQKSTYLIFLLLLSATLQSTNVVVLAGIGIGPQIITSCVYILRSLFLRTASIMDCRVRRPAAVSVLLWLFLISIYFSLSFNGLLNDKILDALQVTFYAITFLLLYHERKTMCAREVFGMVSIITIFVLTMGVVQVLITSNIIPRITLIKELFYNDDSTAVYFNSDQYYRICSTFMEPSYLSCFLVGIFYFYLSGLKKGGQNNRFIFSILLIVIIELILTRSSTGYGALAIGGILYLIISKNRYAKKILCLIAIVGISCALLLFQSLLQEVIFEKDASGSAITRSRWNMEAYAAFLSSPIIGIGYENIRGSSLFPSILGQVGVLGTVTFVAFNFLAIKPLIGRKSKGGIFEGAAIGLICVLIGQLIACPDLDFCVYWLFIWILGILLPFQRVPETKRLISTSCSSQKITIGEAENVKGNM